MPKLSLVLKNNRFHVVTVIHKTTRFHIAGIIPWMETHSNSMLLQFLNIYDKLILKAFYSNSLNTFEICVKKL